LKFYSTNNISSSVDLKEAVLNSLPEDNGLYMPKQIPEMRSNFIRNIRDYSLQEIAFKIAEPFLAAELNTQDILEIVDDAINFEAPVVELDSSLSVLELFHGPSLAFKDFGARFMARLMSKLNQGEGEDLNILVATSGDTGGAVAAGFYNVPGINVIILYPSGRVSELQEKQLTTLGGNITALEIDGSFDDCQALVKKAFLDSELNKKMRLSSANSINIARLIPQTFYYFEAYKQQYDKYSDIVFSIPSGNFGNLTAALMAKKLGLPYKKLIAATNVNKVVPDYLSSGIFQSKESIATISNAMDVGNPSNFARMMDLYTESHPDILQDIVGFYYDDDLTRKAIMEIKEKYDYLMDPHGAVGYLAATDYLNSNPSDHCIVVETAHPCKFDDVFSGLNLRFELPERVEGLMDRVKDSTVMTKDYTLFKDFLTQL
jgi:threonine synthase